MSIESYMSYKVGTKLVEGLLTCVQDICIVILFHSQSLVICGHDRIHTKLEPYVVIFG